MSDLTAFASAADSMPRLLLRSLDCMVADEHVADFCQRAIGLRKRGLVCVSTEIAHKHDGMSLVVCWYLGMRKDRKGKRK